MLLLILFSLHNKQRKVILQTQVLTHVFSLSPRDKKSNVYIQKTAINVANYRNNSIYRFSTATQIFIKVEVSNISNQLLLSFDGISLKDI